MERYYGDSVWMLEYDAEGHLVAAEHTRGEFTETMQITYQNGDTVKTSTRIRGGDTNGDGLLDANDDGIMMRS